MSIASYLTERFGALAFQDRHYLRQPAPQRWTRSSPQHVDVATLERIIPLEMFDACFTIVRHPVARLVSIYHFQQELEASIAPDMGFSDWLDAIHTPVADDPFRYDNHTRPMSEIVPEGATVFHMEYGLDRLIPWLDDLTGTRAGPRAILPENARGQYVKDRPPRVTPSASDLGRIVRMYRADFDRFGYRPDAPNPLAPLAPLPLDFQQERDRAFQRMSTPIARLRRKIVRRLQ